MIIIAGAMKVYGVNLFNFCLITVSSKKHKKDATQSSDWIAIEYLNYCQV
jgi:hypothetical protein